MQGLALRRAVAAGAAAVVSWGVVALPAGAAGARELSLTFESGSVRTNAGTTAMTVTEASRNGGSLTRSAGANGVGDGVRFPAYRAQGAGYAVLVVRPSGGGDVLSPGSAAFTFGVDFSLDATSEGVTADNGDNLLQRGLFNSPMQYKLDVDHRKPGCRVKGTQGTVTVRSSRSVGTGNWFRATCERSGSTLKLTVVRLSDRTTWTYSKSGSIGSLKASASSVPLSVGGKVGDGGSIMTATDQFNGMLDNAFYNVS